MLANKKNTAKLHYYLILCWILWIKKWENIVSLCQQKHMIWRTLFVFDHFFLLFFSSFFQNDFHRIGLRARHVYRLNKPQSYSHTKPNQTKPSQAKSRERHNIFLKLKEYLIFILPTSTSDLCVAFSPRDLCKSIFGISTDETNLIGHVRYKKLIDKRTEMCEWYICYSIFLILPFLSLFTYQMYGVCFFS